MSDASIKNSSIAQIMELLAKVSEKFEPGENEMKQWMTQNFNNPVIVQALQDSTLIMLRVLDSIGRLEPVNGITISKQSRIPKGSVSKVTRRLIAKKMITKESLPNNKKEILFRTTPLGKQIFEAHQAFDQEMAKSFTKFLKKYNFEELDFIVSILQDLLKAKFLAN
jgi:DNA-binding MarR family transcriptional regulator